MIDPDPAKAHENGKQGPRPDSMPVDPSLGVSLQKGNNAVSRDYDPCPRVGRAIERIIQSCSSLTANHSDLVEVDRTSVQEAENIIPRYADASDLMYTGHGGKTDAEPMGSNWDRMEKDETRGLLMTLLNTDREGR